MRWHGSKEHVIASLSAGLHQYLDSWLGETTEDPREYCGAIGRLVDAFGRIDEAFMPHYDEDHTAAVGEAIRRYGY
jgi:hypothetical protein